MNVPGVLVGQVKHSFGGHAVERGVCGDGSVDGTFVVAKGRAGAPAAGKRVVVVVVSEFKGHGGDGGKQQ